MKLTIDRTTLEKLLLHATSAARLAGHLDDDARVHLVSALSDHADAVVHGLAELLGETRRLAARDAIASDDGLAHDGAPMLAADAGGAS